MNLENFHEIQQETEKAILEAMRSKKLKAEVKAELGMKYIKSVNSMKLQTLSTVIQAANLYSPASREEIARQIIPPMSNIIDTNVQVVPAEDFKTLMDSVRAKQEKITLLESEVQKVETEKQKVEDKLADKIDEEQNKEKHILTKIAQQEYQLKRECLS